jgi:hypothetical protein
MHECIHVTIPLAEWSKAQVYSRLIVGIAGSNPAQGMDVGILCLLCFV